MPSDPLALHTWLKHNGVTSSSTPSSATTNALFVEDTDKYRSLYSIKPWNTDVHYVKRCYISAIAVLKMILHAQTGRQQKGASGSNNAASSASASRDEWMEVMGQFQGHIHDNCVVLTDSFGIPVPATAVECALDDAATNYLVQYNELTEKIGKPARVFGWYHTHPGYTSFLSGTDVTTQRFQQMMGGPIVAIVFDPVKTLTSGHIELKAFRTYPENYSLTPADMSAKGSLERDCIAQSRLLGGADPSAGLIASHIATAAASTSTATAASKKREVAFYASSYYEVPITIFRSEKDAEVLDMLWSKCWSTNLSSSPTVEKGAVMTSEIGAIATHLSGGSYALPSVVAEASLASPGGSAGAAATGATANSNNSATTLNATDDSSFGRGAGGNSRAATGARRGGQQQRRGYLGAADDSAAIGFSDVVPLASSVGMDAVQGLLSSHVKQTIFS